MTGRFEKIRSMEVNAFIESGNIENQIKLLYDHASCFTYLSIFSYGISPKGSLIPANDSKLIYTAIKNKIAPIMVISNYINGYFDSTVLHNFLSHKNNWNRFINSVINIVKSKRYYGVNVDFEYVLPEDKYLFNLFLENFKNKLNSFGVMFIISVAPKYSDKQTSSRYSAYDYSAYNRIADRVILMTYEWGWSGGPPMPVAPCNQVKNVLNYAVSQIPKDKLMMGIPLYGYDWEIPYNNSKRLAKTLSPNAAIQLAKKHTTAIHFDTISQSPYFNYFDEAENQHIVWFENELSLKMKYELANVFGLKGISYWTIGRSFPQNWQMLNALFDIKKVL